MRASRKPLKRASAAATEVIAVGVAPQVALIAAGHEVRWTVSLFFGRDFNSDAARAVASVAHHAFTFPFFRSLFQYGDPHSGQRSGGSGRRGYQMWAQRRHLSVGSSIAIVLAWS